MRRWGVVLGLALIGGFSACQLLLPDGMVVRGPILNSMLGRGREVPSQAVVQSRLQVPEGFQLERFAEGVPNARFMRVRPGGDLLVSQPRLGQILHVFADLDGDGRSDGQRVLIADLDRPHGFDFYRGKLFVAEASAVSRLPVHEEGPNSIRVTGPPERIIQGVPEGGNHWSRTLRFGPDGRIYLSVGSSCNVCEEEDPRRAALLRYRSDGTGEEIYADGLRNSVGFDWQPGTMDLYATDNGRDLLGDDYPPCELNRIRQGQFYGWPYANGDRRPDPDFGEGNEARIAETVAPAHGFGAHTAPLGITFLRSTETPEAYRGAALVAQHGSWNRSELSGYKVVSLHWDDKGQITERDFLTGFEVDGDVIGRPVDIVENRKGEIFVSDDYAGTIFRIRRSDESASTSAALKARPTPAASDLAVNPLAGLDPTSRKQFAATGEDLFRNLECGTCHLASKAGRGVVVKPLRGLAGRHSLDSLTDFFLAPTPPMPAFDLPLHERKALAVHLLERFK